MGGIGPAAKDAVPALIKALKDKDFNVRRSAAAAVGKIGPAAKDAVPALIEALKDKDIYVRIGAALLLSRIGPAAKDAVPALKAMSENDPVARVRKAAVAALKSIAK